MQNKDDHNNRDMIDEDLYEEFDDEELYELVQEEKKKALEREKKNQEERTSKRRFPKWVFWLIAIALVFNIFALIPQTFSIPAIEFLQTSARLSAQDDIQTYKESVVVVETVDSRGTGFSISENGMIMTNHHVIEGEDEVTVAFPEVGLFNAEVTEQYPDIDLAILEVEKGDDLPYLSLAEEAAFQEDEHIYFIGNPLMFNGIANEGTIAGYTNLSSWEESVVMLKAPVYRGNSGSPVINQAGEVIGVVFATLHHDVEGRVGLFVPIDYYYERK
ncbi:serine protease [Virgibacillus sp. YIM 98842]|jgi:S1-C subfamily serine protease|uniref:S1 family peptidase n=1 Tax=Virgibacillus sp. YIM 98842 TaxID=2663533 RepID=UPI0013DCF9D9|nr:serine protease [Virgibacillus sp. YIM 98842]